MLISIAVHCHKTKKQSAETVLKPIQISTNCHANVLNSSQKFMWRCEDSATNNTNLYTWWCSDDTSRVMRLCSPSSPGLFCQIAAKTCPACASCLVCLPALPALLLCLRAALPAFPLCLHQKNPKLSIMKSGKLRARQASLVRFYVKLIMKSGKLRAQQASLVRRGKTCCDKRSPYFPPSLSPSCPFCTLYFSILFSLSKQTDTQAWMMFCFRREASISLKASMT